MDTISLIIQIAQDNKRLFKIIFWFLFFCLLIPITHKTLIILDLIGIYYPFKHLISIKNFSVFIMNGYFIIAILVYFLFFSLTYSCMLISTRIKRTLGNIFDVLSNLFKIKDPVMQLKNFDKNITEMKNKKEIEIENEKQENSQLIVIITYICISLNVLTPIDNNEYLIRVGYYYFRGKNYLYFAKLYQFLEGSYFSTFLERSNALFFTININYLLYILFSCTHIFLFSQNSLFIPKNVFIALQFQSFLLFYCEKIIILLLHVIFLMALIIFRKFIAKRIYPIVIKFEDLKPDLLNLILKTYYSEPT